MLCVCSFVEFNCVNILYIARKVKLICISNFFQYSTWASKKQNNFSLAKLVCDKLEYT